MENHVNYDEGAILSVNSTSENMTKERQSETDSEDASKGDRSPKALPLAEVHLSVPGAGQATKGNGMGEMKDQTGHRIVPPESLVWCSTKRTRTGLTITDTNH